MNIEQWALAASAGAMALLVGLVVTNADKFRERSGSRLAVISAIIAFGFCALSSLVNQFWSGQLAGYFSIGHETAPLGQALLVFPGQNWPWWMGIAAVLTLIGLFALTQPRSK